MGDAAAAPWSSGPVYRPPDARPEWEDPAPRPAATVTPLRRGPFRIDAARAEDVLEDVTVARARRSLAVRRRLNRATNRAIRAVELRERQAVSQTTTHAPLITVAERTRLEQERDAAMADLEAARIAVEERLQRKAEAAEAERRAAFEQERIDHAVAEQARLVAEQAERERQAAIEQARAEAERVEQARLAALERARAEELEREAAWAAQLAEEARLADGRRRLALANRLERSAALLREYEEWATSRGLRVAETAGLSVEADRLGHRVDELRYG